MTSNTTPAQDLETARIEPQKKSVTLFHGYVYTLKFSGTSSLLSIGPKGISEVQKLLSAQATPCLETGSPQERDSLISMLDLNEKTVARIDRNSQALGLSFASYLSADLTS
ncbi:hypothetical protein [Roseovarius sp. D0-M9]|uniref:hypothetical protein n=1 Tax=Roseovarius sp. D0-M9 TaxID=3127117 RepID=UPI00300FBFA4